MAHFRAPVPSWPIVPSVSFVNGVPYKEVFPLSHCCSMRVENESLMLASVVHGSVCTSCTRNGTFRLKIRHRTMLYYLQGIHSSYIIENHRYHLRFFRCSNLLSSIMKNNELLGFLCFIFFVLLTSFNNAVFVESVWHNMKIIFHRILLKYG